MIELALQLGCPVTSPSVGNKPPRVWSFGSVFIFFIFFRKRWIVSVQLKRYTDDREECALPQRSPNQITVVGGTDKGVLDTLCGSLISAKVEIMY